MVARLSVYVTGELAALSRMLEAEAAPTTTAAVSASTTVTATVAPTLPTCVVHASSEHTPAES